MGYAWRQLPAQVRVDTSGMASRYEWIKSLILLDCRVDRVDRVDFWKILLKIFRNTRKHAVNVRFSNRWLALLHWVTAGTTLPRHELKTRSQGSATSSTGKPTGNNQRDRVER